VTTSGADRALREAFQFEGADLVANRAARLSSRQTALLRAGRIGMRLSLAVFAGVMLGSVDLVAFFNWRLQTPGGWSSGLGVPAAIAAVVIAGGYLLSRRHLATARSQQVRVAQGPVEVLSDAADDCRVRIGATPLRLPSVAHLLAFQAETEYRVYYLPGSRPIVLSAETLWGKAAAPHHTTATDDGMATADRLAVFRRAYLIVALLGVLALGIPVAGVLLGSFPPGLRPVAWIGLLAVSIGFVWLSLAWLRPRDR
jgi:hypothetical protein